MLLVFVAHYAPQPALPLRQVLQEFQWLPAQTVPLWPLYDIWSFRTVSYCFVYHETFALVCIFTDFLGKNYALHVWPFLSHKLPTCRGGCGEQSCLRNFGLLPFFGTLCRSLCSLTCINVWPKKFGKKTKKIEKA